MYGVAEILPFQYLSKHDISPPDLVQQIRNEVFQETRLTASAGIAANKMLSKICSDINKPDGQYYLPNDREAIMDFVKDLKIRKVSTMHGNNRAAVSDCSGNVHTHTHTHT